MIDRETIKERQQMSLVDKVDLSLDRIKEWYEAWGGQVYVSFSGGKDSTVLLDLVRSVFPDVPGVFINTGLEYPEIVKFVRDRKNIIEIRPSMAFRQVVERYGYPVVSKEQAQRLDLFFRAVKNGKSDVVSRLLHGRKSDGGFKIAEKWKYLLDADFRISAECCNIIKKRPAHRFEKDYGLRPFIGTMMADSQQRRMTLIKHGCNAFDKRTPTSTPLAYWNSSDVWSYIRKYGIPYSEIYNMGYNTTGCMFCCFGVHLEQEPNKFQMMRQTHPKQYKYCMEKLGLDRVLDFVGVPH